MGGHVIASGHAVLWIGSPVASLHCERSGPMVAKGHKSTSRSLTSSGCSVSLGGRLRISKLTLVSLLLPIPLAPLGFLFVVLTWILTPYPPRPDFPLLQAVWASLAAATVGSIVALPVSLAATIDSKSRQDRRSLVASIVALTWGLVGIAYFFM
jgi:hypothetical protein